MLSLLSVQLAVYRQGYTGIHPHRHKMSDYVDFDLYLVPSAAMVLTCQNRILENIGRVLHFDPDTSAMIGHAGDKPSGLQ